MSQQYMLTTNDNPFDPFEDFSNWFDYDIEKGYYSASRLMRIANLTDDMSEVEQNNEIGRAIDEIIRYDVTDSYKKAIKELNDIEEDLETP